MGVPYSYPQALTETPAMRLSRDEIISKNLEIRMGSAMVPEETFEPFVKHYKSDSISPESLSIPLSDPIDDIFSESVNIIEAHIISLPNFLEEERKAGVPQQSLVPQSIKKNSRPILEPLDSCHINSLANGVYSNHEIKTPAKKTNSPLAESSSKKQRFNVKRSTPEAKRSSEVSKRLHSTLEESKQTEDEEIPQDPLACHAGNIMRMAMDSTMMDSFCNHSFSSTFSNLVDDSVLGRGGIDGEDADRSVLERLRAWPKSSLDAKRAKKIEISAEELHSAINDLNVL